MKAKYKGMSFANLSEREEMCFIYFTVGRVYEYMYAGSENMKVKHRNGFVTMTNEQFSKTFTVERD
ncbi:hypothetical protein [Escherichia phage BEK3]|nr:hypothetical protein [Escherichia phage BEK2]QGH76824.1 hypothetical protein [Escherichia phage BEK3]